MKTGADLKTDKVTSMLEHLTLLKSYNTQVDGDENSYEIGMQSSKWYESGCHEQALRGLANSFNH